jgi:hypothetical protein
MLTIGIKNSVKVLNEGISKDPVGLKFLIRSGEVLAYKT